MTRASSRHAGLRISAAPRDPLADTWLALIGLVGGPGAVARPKQSDAAPVAPERPTATPATPHR